MTFNKSIIIISPIIDPIADIINLDTSDAKFDEDIIWKFPKKQVENDIFEHSTTKIDEDKILVSVEIIFSFKFSTHFRKDTENTEQAHILL